MHRLADLARLFLRLGAFGFGGPQAHIAMQNEEVVQRRGWLTEVQFLQGLAICEMLPGPASTQMGIYIGYVRSGWLGALVAGFCFIAPAFLIVVALSWGYFQFQDVPQLDRLFWGISPIVVAIVLNFCWKFATKTLKSGNRLQQLIALIAGLIVWFTSLNVLWIFAGAGVLGVWGLRSRDRLTAVLPLLPGISLTQIPQIRLINRLNPITSPLTLLATTPDVLSVTTFWSVERCGEYALPLALFFLKAGSLIFGGGLTIIPLLEFEVVQQFHWLTHTEFINGVAIGQLSPGPVVLTAAFVGYKVAGVLGAVIATLSIFAPSFAFIMLAAPLLQRLTQNPYVQAFVAGVSPAVLGVIAASVRPLAITAFMRETPLASGLALAIGAIALWLLGKYKLATWKLIGLGAAIGLILGTLLSF